MSRSRIFEEYAKIAKEQGLISEAADEGHLKVDMKPKDYSTRANFKRDELSSSEILYGVQPNGEEKHLMEQAHPEPVIIAPSYDKINGLVENNIERQNIIINQVGRENDGNINYKKLAEQELVFELVRIANDLDIRGENELRSLADDCIEKIATGKVGPDPLARKKEAWVQAVAIVGAVAIGAIYAAQHAPYTNEGLINNIKRAIEMAENIKDDDHWYTSLVKPELKAIMDKTIARLQAIKSSWEAIEKFMLANAGRVPSDAEVMAFATSQQGQQMEAAYKRFLSSIAAAKPELDQLITDLNSESFKESMTADHSPMYDFLGDFSRYVGKALHGGWGLFLDKYDKLRKALEAVLDSLKEENERAKKALDIGAQRATAAKAADERKKIEEDAKKLQESNRSALNPKPPSFNSPNPSSPTGIANQQPDKDDESIFSLE